MEHRGYQAEILYSAETDRFLGHVVNVPETDLVLFDGASVDELHRHFADAIEDYEENLRAAGREPGPAPREYPAAPEE